MKFLDRYRSGTAPLLFILAVLLFYPELFLVKAAPLVGDHWEQHYPWAVLLSDSLRHGVFPYWTSLIGCGFPIAAESQIGVFYLPNLILFRFLPVDMAYAWQLLVHFIISGLGLYLYTRRLGFERLAAWTSAAIFVFGTGYGGAYYNVTSLKTLCWLPWFLTAFESYAAQGHRRWLLVLAVASGMSVVAGYMQVAILGLFVFCVYVLLRLSVVRGENDSVLAILRPGRIGGLLAAGAAGAMIALPQVYLTFQLALLSNRSAPSESFAYAGSLSPLALVTLFLPHFQGLFRGNCLYSGAGALFLVVMALSHPAARRTAVCRLWLLMAAFALLFALGEWSPLYILFIKVTHFYSFRTPAKFLIFFNLASAVLAGAGLHQTLLSLKHQAPEDLRRGVRIFFALLAILAASLVLAFTFLQLGRPVLEKAGEWLVEKTLVGKAGHPHSHDVYIEKLHSVLDFAADLFSPVKFWNRWYAGLYGMLAALLFLLSRTPSRRLLYAVLILSLTDLYAFSYADLRSDFDSFAALSRPDPAVKLLREEKEQGKLGRLYGFRALTENLPLVPSVNIPEGIADIGAYSPLVLSRYFELIGPFGNINDSNTAFSPEPAFVLERLPVLASLGVTHVIAARQLEGKGFQSLAVTRGRSGKTWIYQLTGGLREPAYFVTKTETFPEWTALKERYLSPGFDPQKTLLLEGSAESVPVITQLPESGNAMIRRLKQEPASSLWSAIVPGEGYFVLNDLWYPGWKVYINGFPQKLQRAYGVFRAVHLPAAGEYAVEFRYELELSLKAKS